MPECRLLIPPTSLSRTARGNIVRRGHGFACVCTCVLVRTPHLRKSNCHCGVFFFFFLNSTVLRSHQCVNTRCVSHFFSWRRPARLSPARSFFAAELRPFSTALAFQRSSVFRSAAEKRLWFLCQ